MVVYRAYGHLHHRRNGIIRNRDANGLRPNSIHTTAANSSADSANIRVIAQFQNILSLSNHKTEGNMSHQRVQETNRRLCKTYNATKNGYGAGVWYNEKKKRYIRYKCQDKDLKARCRRTTRRRLKDRYFGEILDGGTHKKVFDYWGTLL